MKNNKILGVILSLALIISQIFSNYAYAQCFEEDDDTDIAIIEDNQIEDVDIDNMLSSIRVSARNAIALDSKTKQILFEQSANEIVPMASTTKIMTCIIALENGNLEDMVTASSYAASMPKVKLYLREGEQYKLRDLLYSLMLS